MIVGALDKVDRRGFDPADIAAGEALLTEHAALFPPEDLRLLADRVVDAIDPDGTVPNDQLNEDRRYFHLRATRDGAYVGDFRLTGAAGAKLKTLLDPLAKLRIDPSGAVDGRTHGQRLHDALEDLCDRQLRAGDVPDTGGIPATVIVTIDAQDLIDRVGHGRTADGTVLPTGKLLQLANNADIIPTVLTASGAVLDLGRSRRIASRPQTLALIARDGGCSFPGCAHPPQYCERHHIRIARRRAEEKREDTFFVFERRRSRRPPSAIQRAERAIKHRVDRRRTDEPEQYDFGLRLPPSQLPGPRLDLPHQHRRDSRMDPTQVGRPRTETHDQHPHPSRPHRPETRTTEQADHPLKSFRLTTERMPRC